MRNLSSRQVVDFGLVTLALLVAFGMSFRYLSEVESNLTNKLLLKYLPDFAQMQLATMKAEALPEDISSMFELTNQPKQEDPFGIQSLYSRFLPNAEAIDVSPLSMRETPVSWFWLGIALELDGNTGKAFEVWAEVGAIQHLVKRMEIAFEDEDYVAVSSIGEEILEACNADVDTKCDADAVAQVWAWLGRVHLETQAYERAAEAFGLASQLSPNRAEFLGLLAQSYMKSGSLSKALVLYEGLVKDYPDRYIYFLNLGEVYQQLGLILEAETAFQSAVNLTSNPRALQAFANFASSNGDVSLLDEIVLNAFEKYPDQGCEYVSIWEESNPESRGVQDVDHRLLQAVDQCK